MYRKHQKLYFLVFFVLFLYLIDIFKLKSFEQFSIHYLVSLTPKTRLGSFSVPVQAQTQTSRLVKVQLLIERGEQYFKSQKFNEALKIWQEALSYRKELQTLNSEGIVLGRLGYTYQKLGNTHSAIRYYELALLSLKHSDHKLSRGSVYGNLGKNYNDLGRYAAAIQNIKKSIEIWEDLKRVNQVGKAKRTLGQIYISLGNYPLASQQLAVSLKLAKSQNDSVAIAQSYYYLGLLCLYQDDIQKAVDYFRESKVIAATIQDVDQRKILLARINIGLGDLDLSQGFFSKALKRFINAKKISTSINNKRLEIISVQRVASTYLLSHSYESAWSILQNNLDLAKELNDPEILASNYHLIGSSLWKLDRLNEAEDFYRKAISLFDITRKGLKDLDQVSIFETQVHSYALLRRVLVEQGKYDEALEASEHGRLRAFIDLKNKSSISNNTLFSINRTPLPRLKSLQDVAKKQNATLVEYAYVADEEYVARGKSYGDFIKLYIWVVHPSGEIDFAEVNLDDQQNKLLEKAGSWPNEWAKNSFTDPELYQDFEDLHEDLYEILIAPIKEKLPKDPSSSVIFIPYRELFQVSFSALKAPDKSYLIEKHTILSAPSIQVLELLHNQQSKSSPRRKSSVLVIGNPNYPTQGPNGETINLENLSGSEEEVTKIATLYGSEAVTGPKATETLVKNQIASADLIHFATHGLLYEINTQHGIPGAIALSADHKNDGFLTSDEILTLNLKADLIVVSACDTGRGYLTGDGVIGLSRSLMASGVSSLILSLWEVDDLASAVFMTEFHKHYKQSQNKAQALREAMLKIKEEYEHPVFWAPFILIGNSE